MKNFWQIIGESDILWGHHLSFLMDTNAVNVKDVLDLFEESVDIFEDYVVFTLWTEAGPSFGQSHSAFCRVDEDLSLFQNDLCVIRDQ